MIIFSVENQEGELTPIEVPENISLNLMEVLKASGYEILATCGGMALCATCCVKVIKGAEQLPEPGDAELDILDTLPFLQTGTRLSCQLAVNQSLQNCVFKMIDD